MAPFFNEFALSGKDMGFLCKEYSVIREVPEMKVADFLMQTLVGSVEHTRNGYDRLKSVQDKNQKLVFAIIFHCNFRSESKRRIQRSRLFDIKRDRGDFKRTRNDSFFEEGFDSRSKREYRFLLMQVFGV